MKKPVPFYFFFIVLCWGTLHTTAQVADIGKSFVNINKSLNGGTVEPNDTLEIRASFVVRSGTYDSCAYFDVIPAGTVYVPNSIRILTNEGKIYKQFTDAMGDDPGWINGSNIRINLGYRPGDAPATATVRGRVRNTHKPNFGNACILIASFRVTVNVPLGSTLNCGGGSMTYKSGLTPVTSYTFPVNNVAVYKNFGMCANVIGANTLGTEFNGTFGSGKPRNRSASLNVPPSYAYAIFTTNTPNDYTYGVANNTSTRTNYTTLNTWPKPDNSSPTHRVFNVWDIIGDHTGAANQLLGNPAADTVTNNNAGYMLVVNASYRIDSAFQQTITNLCPNTYYEISLWMRNICSRCGYDSNGTGPGTTGYIPTAPGDSSGVYPNLTFKVNDTSYYSTGYIKYTGQWVQKGFTYKTGMTQTSLVLKVFNNASGGGGNDWAIDDIAMFTCNPNISFSPDTLNVCQYNTVGFSGTVTSLFNNYTEWRWEKSTDNGVTWTSDTTGSSTPVWNGSQYVYTVTHNPKTFFASDSGTRYRLVIATTSTNLNNPNCIYSGTGNQIVVIVRTTGACMILPVNFTSFNARKNNNEVNIEWSAETEVQGLRYDIERSADGYNFQAIGSLPGSGISPAWYGFTDHNPIIGTNYYRIKAVDAATQKIIYSRIAVINMLGKRFVLTKIINPFRQSIDAEVSVPQNGQVKIWLADMNGRIIRTQQQTLPAGINQLSIQGLAETAPGIYALHIEMNGDHEIRKLIKTN